MDRTGSEQVMGIFSRTKRAAILGCGPSGMFAAHAFVQAGWEVTIYSKPRKSHMFGAQYLHSPIPGLPERRITIEYQLRGSAAVYAEKVYGHKKPVAVSEVSATTLVGQHPAWDIRAAYDEAYSLYEGLIIPVEINTSWIDGEFGNPAAKGHWSAIVSTIPAPSLCARFEEHMFHSTRVWAAGDAPELGRLSPVTVPANTVVCNGEPDIAWYRCANVFGHNTCEWPHDRKPPVSGLAEVMKPIRTDCSCYPTITRLGRYGQWQKGVLTDEVYVRAAKIAAKG